MKSSSNSRMENSAVTAEKTFPRLHLTTAFTLMVMVILFFVWEFYESDYTKFFIREEPPSYYYSTFSVIVIVVMLVVSLMAWLATIRTLYSSQKTFLLNDIARKKSEEALRISEAYFRDLLDNANDLFYTTDLQGNFTSLNKVGKLIADYTYDEAVKLNISDVVAPEYLEIAQQMTAQKLEGEPPTTYELEILTKDKRRVTMEVSTRLIYEAQQPIGIQGIARDITDRKSAEKELQKNLSLLTSTLEATAEGILVVDLNNKIVTYNKQFIEMWRIPDEIISSKNNEKCVNYVLDQLINPDDFVNTTNSMNAKPEIESFDILLFKDGKIYERYSHPQMLAGKVAGRVLSFRDITERKRAEDTLRESESILAAAQRITHLGSWELYLDNLEDLNKNEVRWSNETYRIFGYEADQVKASNELFYKSVHPEDRALIKQSLIDAISQRKVFEVEHRAILPDGSERIIQGQAELIVNEQTGKPVKLFGTVQDVTERRRTDAALRESEYKLRTLISSMGEGLAQADNDELIEFANERLCEMTGYTQAELLGKSTFDIFFDEEGRLTVDKENNKRRQGFSGQYEARLRKKSGAMLWVLISGAPIVNADGIITGTLGVFMDITERKRTEEKMVHDAFHDSLTGLANRALFSDHLRLRIERSKRDPEEMFAVLFLDFDRFKVVNDSLGHAEGDELLILIARRLESVMRSCDLVARLGGDEFTILLGKLDAENDAVLIAERIQENLKTPFEIGGSEIFMSASIGIALSTIGHTKAEDMLRDADIAMYCAKANGKARHQVFDQAMHDRALMQLQMETDIRQAFERGEFSLYYQPIFVIETKDLAGFEALIRWNHPERGMVSPGEFIPVAEENGLILPLGRWILFESCRQMREWQDKNPAAKSLKLSVNLSCKQFLQPDLVEQVIAALVSTRLEAHCLKLEITESHLMENSAMSVKMMKRLREIGVELSLDDFGTGYSSLSYLHRLPVNYLKIDRSFVSRMTESTENGEIVNTIIKLAQSLKMKVIAEGIETADQLAQLKHLSCEYGQGYFYSKPLEAEAAKLFIDRMNINSSMLINEQIINLELNM